MNSMQLIRTIKGSSHCEKILVQLVRFLTLSILLIAAPLTASAAFTIDTTSTKVTGLFWNADESGWGVGINQQSDIIFVTLFTYNQNNQPKWYVVSNCAISEDTCTGRLFEVNNGSALTDTWDGSGKVTTDIGMLTLQFSDENNVSISGVLNGASITKNLERQLFGTLTPDAPMNALIWNESESGWGATLTQQEDTTFVVIYTYDTNGFPVWYVASNCAVSGDSCNGTLYSVTGGTSVNGPWEGSNKLVNEVGQVTVTLRGDNTGSLVFDIDGLSGNKSITRQTWAMDSDRDGISDNNDNCPNAVNANQRDDDGDGVGNVCGSPLITTITPSGGTALSNDGKVKLTFPAGAVPSNTDIIVTNNSDGELIEYTLEPSGTTFDQPITLTHTVSNSERESLTDSNGQILEPGSATVLTTATLTSDDNTVEYLSLSSHFSDNNLITTTELEHFSSYKQSRESTSGPNNPRISLKGGGDYPLGSTFSGILIADAFEGIGIFLGDSLLGLDSVVPTTLDGSGAISPVNNPEFIRSEIRERGNYELFKREFKCMLIGSGQLISLTSIRIILDRLDAELSIPRSYTLTAPVNCTGTPIVSETCTGVKHGTGQSTVNACVQYTNVVEGEIVRFSFSDGVSTQEIEIPVDENGKACLAATIFVFGQYTWQADLLDSSEAGSIIVDANEQSCSLIAE